MEATLSDRLDRMVVTASTSDGALSAELYDRDQVRITFEQGSYRWLDERTLERHLVSLARVLWSRRMREFWMIMGEVSDYAYTAEPLPVTPAQQEFVERRENIVARGASADGRVQLSVRGMHEWKAVVRDGTLTEIGPDDFVAGVRTAAEQLIADQLAQITAVKNDLADRLD
ncbi:hypothetical protein [Hamadaea tsunoensis]|uniref:hypothetical protein n=1 Tax=Hamadaea tsunoensis TaxID=53368 RepID=UPI000417E043|nr:hypothetical protein [Hamadaea tsunoensis]